MRFGAISVAVAGIIAGMIAIVGVDWGNRLTSTDAFCIGCHVMKANIADDPVFRAAPHQNAASGVRAGCADCHIRDNGLIGETFTHAWQGIKDVYALFRHDYDDPAVWEAQRARLAHVVRDRMRGNDSATCRSCHDLGRVVPNSRAGKAAHELASEGRRTCIQCHYNLVHRPVPTRPGFTRLRK